METWSSKWLHCMNYEIFTKYPAWCSLWYSFFVGCGILLRELTIHFLTLFHCYILFYMALLMQDIFPWPLVKVLQINTLCSNKYILQAQ